MTDHSPDLGASTPSAPARAPSGFDATARPLAPRPMEARTPYRIRSAETWDLVRTHYLRGESARALSERYGVSVSNIRRRAGDEGWTRKGHAEAVDHFRLDGPPSVGTAHAASAPAASAPAGGFADPYPGAPEAEPLDAEAVTEPGAVARLALAATARALRAGRFAEAERLGRLAETLTRLSAQGGAPSDDVSQGPAPMTADTDEEYLEWCRNKIDQRFDWIAQRLDKEGILQDVIDYCDNAPPDAR